ncbi:MAG: ROK family protein [Spirochaetota bacterium]
MAWATVVKMVRRLEAEGYIQQVGFDESPSVQGPGSVLYDLVDGYPLAIGVDIEYEYTHASLVDLRGKVWSQFSCKTPSFASMLEVVEYCVRVRESIMENQPDLEAKTVGLGVAMPLFLVTERENLFTAVQSRLAERIDGFVVVDDVARAYALHKQHERFDNGSFAVVTIRSGLGLGISVNGRLFRGDENYAGLISHLVLEPGSGTICPHCGQEGCLETVVNGNLLPESKLGRAEAGDLLAVRDVEGRADALARALSFVILVMNIELIYVAGHFGDSGEFFVSLVNEAMKSYVPPFLPHSVQAESLAEPRFPIGIAFLVLSNFCNYELGREPPGH